VNELFDSQLKDWNLASVNYQLLSKVKTRAVDFDGFRIFVQFNPERIRSSAAKVDAKSIHERPCFLCEKNRPAEQKGIQIGEDLVILVNPFPIFNRHLTIPTNRHTDQRIKGNFGQMLFLAKVLPDFIVFYNGPECGASAPDHLHFQAGNRGFLPVETDFEKMKLVKIIRENHRLETWYWSGYHRGMLTLRGEREENVIEAFLDIYNKLAEMQPGKSEPMLNILAYFSGNKWVVHIIPRKLHRPTQYFAEEDKRILLSPASVDLGGVIIVPREEDFVKITAEDIIDIFSQVCMDENEIINLISYA
jgi:hypothetical protein